jgi:hypothetical protein
MDDAAELIEEDEEEKPKLEGVTRILEIGGRAILIAYGVGFFVDSYFDAKYGVTYLNPFRSRVAFTGIALLIQVAIIVLVFTGEAVWRLSSTFWALCASEVTGRSHLLYKTSFLTCWLIDTIFLGLLMRFALTLYPSYLHAQFASFFASLFAQGQSAAAPSQSAAEVAAFHFPHPILAALSLFLVLTIPNLLKLKGAASSRLVDLAAASSIVCGLLFLWAEMQGQDSLAWSFVVYVLLVRFALIARQADPGFQRSGPRLAIAALVILIPVLYAERIYTNVLPQWGGAPKIQLLIRFEHQIVPFGCAAPAFLLEETEEGYYLLRPDSDTDASAQASLDVESAPCPVTAQAKSAANPKPAPESPSAHIFDPRAYSAVYVPRREVFQVLYKRSPDE